MSKPTVTPAWLIYERCVAAFALQNFDEFDITIQPNVNIMGHLSGIERQIDVLVDTRWEDHTERRLIIDAKDRSRKVDVKEIESFEGMMKDCRSSRGVIVCSKGYSEAALRRAQDAITITVLTLDDLDDYNWTYEPCYGECNHNKKRQTSRGMVLWGACLGLPSESVIQIAQTGKCDGCHSFHVWCWECGWKFAVPDNQVVVCECQHRWISSPTADEIDNPQSMWLMLGRGEYGLILDRRPIR